MRVGAGVALRAVGRSSSASSSATRPQGFTALIVAITFFAGIQLLFLGLIGEYLGRVYDEAKGRPHFVITDVVRGEAGTTGASPLTSAGTTRTTDR